MTKTTIITFPAQKALYRTAEPVPAWAANTIAIYAPDQDVATFHFRASQDVREAAEAFAKAYSIGGREVQVVHDG